jgi:hypothetical protein
MNLNFKNHIISLLLHDDRLKDEQGELKGNLVKEFANTILKEENKNYRLVGLPLYNKASENVFKQSVIESLNIQI